MVDVWKKVMGYMMIEAAHNKIQYRLVCSKMGLKFRVGESPLASAATYRHFNNELVLGDNTVLAELDEMKITFLNHSVINYVATRDERFNAHMADAIQNLVKKSTQLSGVGEKERTRFFNRIRYQVKGAAGM